MLIIFKRLLPYLFVFFLMFSYKAEAQLLGTDKNNTEESIKVPDDSLGRRTPQGTVNGFIKAIGDQNYLRASQFLVLSRKSYRKKAERIRIAKVFQQLLDQKGNILASSIISNKEMGQADDDLAQDIDFVGSMNTDDTVIKLFVENQSVEGEPALWLFSAETVEAVVNANPEEKISFLDKILPDFLKENKLFSVPIGHWLVMVIMSVFSFFIAKGLIYLITFIIQQVWKKANSEKSNAFIEAFRLPIELYAAVVILVELIKRIGISIVVRQRFSNIILTVGIIAFLMLLWRIVDYVSVYSRARMTQKGRISAVSTILFLNRITKISLVVIGIIAILGVIGVDITAGLAAIGIGGIALALGAQKTIENFVGSVSLIADQPIRVGDFCKIDDVKGVVESIGVRSTKIRTAVRSVVTIPNGQLSANKIENFAYRDRFLFNPVFTFRMETTPDQVRYLLVELRSLLYAHPVIINDPVPNVRFTGITADALKVEVVSYIGVPTFESSQEVQEDLLLRMLDIIEKSGTSLAYPSQTLYFSRDTPTSAEKSAEISDVVKKWKENNELQLPNFDPKRVEELKGSITYPNEGSYKPEV